MKKYLFATAFAAAALVSTSALAETSGYVGLAYGNSNIDTSFGDVDVDAFTLNGSLFAPVSEKLGLQFDGAIADSDDADPSVSGAAHLVGQVGAGRVGGFVSGADLNGDTLWGVGAEGQYAVSERVTLAGVLAYAGVEEADIDVVGVAAQGRYFVNDNLRLDANLGYLDAQDVDVSAWNIGVGAEYQIPGQAFSVFGGYNRTEIDDLDADVDTFSIGVRVNFGGTLKSRDRDGASLPGIGGLTSVVSAL